MVVNFVGACVSSTYSTYSMPGLGYLSCPQGVYDVSTTSRMSADDVLGELERVLQQMNVNYRRKKYIRTIVKLCLNIST